MMTLFGNLESGNVHKVQMLLHRLEIPFRRVDVSQPKGEPRRAEYLKINPIGKVPSLMLEDGDIITESGAILFYLAQGSKLWPGDRRAQTEVLRWMFFEQYSHEPALAVMRYLIADFALYPYTAWAHEAGVELQDYPALRRWLLQIESEPRFLPLLQDGAAEAISFAEFFEQPRAGAAAD